MLVIFHCLATDACALFLVLAELERLFTQFFSSDTKCCHRLIDEGSTHSLSIPDLDATYTDNSNRVAIFHYETFPIHPELFPFRIEYLKHNSAYTDKWSLYPGSFGDWWRASGLTLSPTLAWITNSYVRNPTDRGLHCRAKGFLSDWQRSPLSRQELSLSSHKDLTCCVSPFVM